MAGPWFERALDRLDPKEAQSRSRAASLAYKSIQLAQIVFGELTLNKKQLPSLYSRFVPGFPMKKDGSRLIREILDARYPHNPPRFAARGHYRELVAQLWDLVEVE